MSVINYYDMDSGILLKTEENVLIYNKTNTSIWLNYTINRNLIDYSIIMESSPLNIGVDTSFLLLIELSIFISVIIIFKRKRSN